MILVINGVSTIYLWRKNEEKGPILSEISVFKKNKLRKNEKRKCQQNGKNFKISKISKASKSVPGGLEGCLNTFLSLCVNQLSNVCSINLV